ncbi:hypothetical protein IW140_004730 [Coemansia sp. RSA 1813]|nr:hypothetical protein EV178_004058 [Coemansia sp. RSA 1646]KAJ1770417.1 hypothetical protein LPJ74_003224 [Coemansia sp. RSA 1843]KAJ2088233.1 hypothetical protein IW138_004405 [Coemansia sp. RSA 986]KAJ2215725.1 hypothetical protein EV179_001949 [Coemansia sp. RSA 487]KAJ2566939.1 hypothetical protein IW140_004730 [Coemansia sp. RSA 1813]
MPVSYILVFERTPPEYIVFASSNCLKAIGYTPEEMLGTSALDYSSDPYAKHYSCAWPADNPELGVTMMPHNLVHKNGDYVFTHYIAINCSGYIFALIHAFPELGRVEMNGDSLLYKLQHELSFAEEYKGENAHASSPAPKSLPARPVEQQPAQAQAQAQAQTEPQVPEQSQQEPENESQGLKQSQEPENVADLVNPQHPLVTKETLHKAHIFTARAARAKACFILNHADDSIASQGPTIDFVTNSVSDIFGGDTDGHEITDKPFLSLVAPQDVTKAAVYLDNLHKVTKPQLCGLRILHDPIGSSAQQSQDDKYIHVELFGASSGDKILLLCQKRREKGMADAPAVPGKMPVGEVSKLPPTDDDMAQYMTLEQIISSNPDTTDIDGHWSEVMF